MGHGPNVILGSSYHADVGSSVLFNVSKKRLHSLIATAQTLGPNVQDGSIFIQDILALIWDSVRKWRQGYYVYIPVCLTVGRITQKLGSWKLVLWWLWATFFNIASFGHFCKLLKKQGWDLYDKKQTCVGSWYQCTDEIWCGSGCRSGFCQSKYCTVQ